MLLSVSLQGSKGLQSLGLSGGLLALLKMRMAYVVVVFFFFSGGGGGGGGGLYGLQAYQGSLGCGAPPGLEVVGP